MSGGRATRERSEAPEGASGAPGWAAAIFDRDGVRERWLHGAADLRGGAPASADRVRADTRFRWFSVSKIATATAVLALVDDGALRLDDEARDHLDWMSPLGAVTIEQLLAHASGLPVPRPHGWVHPPGAPRRSPEQLTRDALEAPNGPTGRARYSNLNYLALGELARAAAARPFAELLQARVLGPAAIHASFRTQPAAVGYERWGLRAAVMGALFLPHTRRLVSHVRVPWIGLAPLELEGEAYGGLLGSIEALERLGRLHLNDGTLDGAEVLGRDAARAMRGAHASGAEGTFGYGWWHLGGGWVGHGGEAGGHRAALRIHAERGVGVAVLANGGAARTDRVADRLAARA